jgi:molybdopterin molybdotransferase
LPVLFKIQGEKNIYHNIYKATISQDLNFKGKRLHMVLGELKDGVFYPTNGGKVGSGMITPLTNSNAVAYFEEGVSQIKKHSVINVVSLKNSPKIDKFITNS